MVNFRGFLQQISLLGEAKQTEEHKQHSVFHATVYRR